MKKLQKTFFVFHDKNTTIAYSRVADYLDGSGDTLSVRKDFFGNGGDLDNGARSRFLSQRKKLTRLSQYADSIKTDNTLTPFHRPW